MIAAVEDNYYDKRFKGNGVIDDKEMQWSIDNMPDYAFARFAAKPGTDRPKN